MVGTLCEVLARVGHGGNSYKYGYRLDLPKRAYLFYVLTALYPHARVMMWKEGVVQAKVTVMICSQWLPPKTHAIWKNSELKHVLAQVASPRFKSWLDWKSFLLRIKHQELGGMTDAEVPLHVFSSIRFTPKKVKHHPPRMVSPCC
jgi:hypothetical protein